MRDLRVYWDDRVSFHNPELFAVPPELGSEQQHHFGASRREEEKYDNQSKVQRRNQSQLGADFWEK